MQTLVLIRHAIAEERETWRGKDDAQRPLTDAGRRQAQRIARLVMTLVDGMDSGAALVSLRTSPTLRCVHTLEPLAKRAGMDLVIEATLTEGLDIALPSPRLEGVHVICAHGDNIPWLLEELKIDWKGQCKKGSLWVIQRDGRGRVLVARYQSVPKD